MGIARNVVLAACLATVLGYCALGAEWFVSPTGKAGNAGTKDAPWDIASALKKTATVKPGDTVWLLGGTYTATGEGFVSTLAGTEKQPIIVRNYDGQHATLDGKGSGGGPIIRGAYVWFWGMEALDSKGSRYSNTPYGSVSNGVCVYGKGVKCINMIVHDTAEGFSAYNASPDSEYYGNLVYYNGYSGSDRCHGHGIYMQNVDGLKTVNDNFVGDNSCEGFQIYGSGNANVEGFRIDGNIIYNNGWGQFQYAFIVAGGKTRKNIEVTNNYSFLAFDQAQGSNTFGLWTPGDDMIIKDNVLAGGYVTSSVNNQAGPLIYTGNKIITNPKALSCQFLYVLQNQNTQKYTWDKNEYWGYGEWRFGYAPKAVLDKDGGRSYYDWKGWKKITGFDANSTFKNEMPSGVWTYVRPNKYEPGRANVCIFNWDKKDKVEVDIAASGLKEGDAYEIRDAQNFFAKPVVEGKYDGKPVSIPMTGLAKAPGIGFKPGPHTAPMFGTFVVLKQGMVK